MFVWYRDVGACGIKPVTDKVEAGYSSPEVDPVGLREQVDPRDQFFSNAVMSIVQGSVGLSQGAAQHTLQQWGTQKQRVTTLTVLYISQHS